MLLFLFRVYWKHPKRFGTANFSYLMDLVLPKNSWNANLSFYVFYFFAQSDKKVEKKAFGANKLARSKLLRNYLFSFFNFRFSIFVFHLLWACPCFAGSPPYGFRFAHGFATASRPSRRLTQKLTLRCQPPDIFNTSEPSRILLRDCFLRDFTQRFYS
jgi:hypothetical protein